MSTSREVRELTAGRELDALVANKIFGAFGFENIDVINGTPNELHNATADTAPLAICKAALLAVEK